jgi:hypothetical protein
MFFCFEFEEQFKWLVSHAGEALALLFWVVLADV